MRKLLFLIISLLSINLFGQNYNIVPVPPNFTVDSNTTFLVDFTTLKSNADFSVGNSNLTVNTNYFVLGGYTNTFGFVTSNNLPTNAFTIEMIIDVPYSMSTFDPIMLGEVSSGGIGIDWQLKLTLGFGVQEKLYSYNTNTFLAQPFAGGNGNSIQGSASDKLVYIAYGLDFSNQVTMVCARNMDGSLLNSNISFNPGQGSITATNWLDMRDELTRAIPSIFNIGNSNVLIQSFKISNVYKSNLFSLVPILPVSSTNIWTAQQIDPSRTTNQIINRTVGYGSYNLLSMPVNESYIKLNPGDSVSITLTNVPIGLYSFMVWGQIYTNGRTSLNQVWQPAPMYFTAFDSSSNQLARGEMLLKQAFIPRRMQGFHVHNDEGLTNIILTFTLSTNSLESVLLQEIAEWFPLSVSPMIPIKTAQYLGNGYTNQITSVNSARMLRDDQIWNALPPLNTQLEIQGQYPGFETPPTNITADNWQTAGLVGVAGYAWFQHVFDPLDMTNVGSGNFISQHDITNSVPWTSTYPDDGCGVFFSQSNYPFLPSNIYNSQRAELLGWRYLLYFGGLVNARGSISGYQNALTYFNAGDTNIGMDGAIQLIRMAYDWPALEMNLHEIRTCIMSPDLFNDIDWTYMTGVDGEGKMEYTGWSGFQSQYLMEAYDQLFPFIKGNTVLASEIHRYIPWVNTPQDVIMLLDNYLFFPTVFDITLNEVDPTDNIPGYTGEVLGPNIYSRPWFDYSSLFAVFYPSPGGTYQEMYGSALPRSGSEYVGSFQVYAFGQAEVTIQAANSISYAISNNLKLPINWSNTKLFPKIRSAGNFMVDMWVAGGYPFMIGDSSGGPHSTLNALPVLGAATNYLFEEFQLDGDPRIAWLLQNDFGISNSAITAAAATTTDPILFNTNRVVPDWGAILELNPTDTEITNKTSLTLRLGIGAGHVHGDYLDIGIFSMGMPLTPDTSGRNEEEFWTRPPTEWTFMHDHAMASTNNDPSSASDQSGEPWLRSFSPPLLGGSYTGSLINDRLDRDIMLMQIGTNQVYYAFDVQRLSGGTYHTWCFHGCESSNLVMNVPMTNASVLGVTNEWLGRTLPGYEYQGLGSNLIQATWIMTRAVSNFTYTFDGGGNFNTFACEQATLGTNYNSNAPPVSIRATVFGRSNDIPYQGNAYSAFYQYSFPFLWLQTTNESTSVYPALYEWYRGSTPTIASAVQTQTNPVEVVVTTTSGQTDTFDFATNYSLAVSRDASGIRYIKLVGSNVVSLSDLTISGMTNYSPTITDINYTNRTLTTSSPLPRDPVSLVGNTNRESSIYLFGPAGTNFYFNDDILINEGLITSLHTTSPSNILFTEDQAVLFDGDGNRNSQGMTMTTEDGHWHFRNNAVIKSPAGIALTPSVFTDANKDGLIDIKTYEFGVGDTISIPFELTITRNSLGWAVKQNSQSTISISGLTIHALQGSQQIGTNGWPLGIVNTQQTAPSMQLN